MYDEFLIKTTSRNYVVRLFYFLFACLMYNAWVLYNAQQELRKEDEIIVMQMKTLLLIVILLECLEAYMRKTVRDSELLRRILKQLD